jgi:hypothetical protein
LVGWSMSAHPDAELVVDALVMALSRAEPDTDGLIHHSDKGGAYVSGDFCSMATLAGVQVSFGSTGDCWDNAAMEAFWSTLKREIAWIRGSIHFDTRDHARLYLFEFIEVFYNRQRHQTALSATAPQPSTPLPSTPENRKPRVHESGSRSRCRSGRRHGSGRIGRSNLVPASLHRPSTREACTYDSR